MRIRKITGVLMLCLVSIGAAACNPLGGNTAAPAQQLVQVTRGDITITVTGSGNIEAPQEVNLTFGSGGKVDKIYVTEGDTVSKGEVLAQLDASTLELALSQAQVAVTQAQLALTQAQLARQTAEKDLKSTQDTQAALELALLNSQIATKTASYNLSKAQDTYRWPEVETAQANVDKAKTYLQYTLDGLAAASTDAEVTLWSNAVTLAQGQLDAAQAKLDAQLGSYDTEEVAIKKLQLESAQKAEAQAQKDLTDLSDAITIKEMQLKSAQESEDSASQAVELARKSLAQAQKQLDEATITAPFDGAIATVGAKEGEPVTAVTTIIYLVNPGSMELLVDVDEIDIPDVKLGQQAILTLDSLPGKEFSGSVAAIFPVPNLVGGVVLYKVKISLDAPQDSGIRVGMSASADIITHKSTGVLLVPSRAITQDAQGNPEVEVMVNGQAQTRPVVTGLSDITQTEIISGLSEGETVVAR